MQPREINVIEKLSRLSVEHHGNPYQTMQNWPETIVPGADWHMSPSLISLVGIPEYEALDERMKRTVSFYEALNFYSLNIHGERSLIEHLAERLYRKWPKEISDYLHHFIGEENNHMILFGGFCLRYAGKIYPDRHLTVPREHAPGEQDFLFLAQVLIFEEIVDFYNQENAKDETLHFVSREINRLHRLDEARHLSFGRLLVADVFAEYSPKWDAGVKDRVQEQLGAFLKATCREYVNPDVYKDAGFTDVYALARRVWDLPETSERRRTVARKVINYFLKHNILTVEPQL